MGEIKILKENGKLHGLAKPIEYTENSNGCWIVLNRTFDKGGYAHLMRNRKRLMAHRYSYECFKGQIPDGKLIMHMCDTPSCINPDHLKIGTDIENINDKQEKGRQPKGEKHWNCKLNENTVIEIDGLIKSGSRVLDLASKYGVSLQAIRDIKTRRRWSYLFEGNSNN